MKKSILVCLVCLLCFVSCDNVKSAEKVNSEETTSMFVEVEESYYWRVVYHKETRVMYVVSEGEYNRGVFTLMVDREGKPLLWKK